MTAEKSKMKKFMEKFKLTSSSLPASGGKYYSIFEKRFIDFYLSPRIWQEFLRFGHIDEHVSFRAAKLS